jgi:DNA-binding CsgD family transcriptional regulator/N-acetylneuraminic acid mutarotase
MSNAEAPISDREIEVLRLVATGATNREIAIRLVISVNTVKVHLRNIFEKLDVQSRTEATLYAIQQGWVEVDGVEPAATDLPHEGTTAPVTVTSMQKPLSWWQRAYLLVALTAAFTLLLLPFLRQEVQAVPLPNLITDQPMPSSPSLITEPSRWIHLSDLPIPRARLALAAHNGQLFAVGGDQETGVTGLVDIYSPETDTWSSGASKPTPVSNVGAAVIGDRIYVPGGCIGLSEVTDRMEVYTPSNDTWDQVASLPIPLCAYALATVDEKIYLFGGWDGQRFVDHVYIYDPDNDNWTDGEPMPVARGFAAAGAIEGVVYVVGGYDSIREFADNYAYHISDDTWTQKAPMSIGRGGLGAAVVGDKLYAIGGGWRSFLSTNERYDPVSNSWIAFESPVLSEWRNLGVAPSDTQIYAVGGWSGGGYAEVNQGYQAILRIILPIAQ